MKDNTENYYDVIINELYKKYNYITETKEEYELLLKKELSNILSSKSEKSKLTTKKMALLLEKFLKDYELSLFSDDAVNLVNRFINKMVIKSSCDEIKKVHILNNFLVKIVIHLI